MSLDRRSPLDDSVTALAHEESPLQPFA